MLLDILTWWQALPNGEQWFWGLAILSNIFFVLYLVVQFAGGHDVDADGGLHLDGPDTGFTILSVRSLLAFGMFMGYTGVVATRQGASWPVALFLGTVAGVLAAWLAWRLLRLLLRLQASGTLDLENAIGQTGEVHLRIPTPGLGSGKVMVQVQGALRELDAVSEEQEIPTGTSILVVGTTENGTLIVQPFQSLTAPKIPLTPTNLHKPS